MLLPETTLDVAEKLAAIFCRDISEAVPGVPHAVTASIGVSDVSAVEITLRQADRAMYAAKAAGRNGAVVYSPEVEQSYLAQPHEHSVAAPRAERDRLHTEARTDALTGLGNRRALDEFLATYRGQRPVSVLFIDLDRFGAYNHRHGDQQGDSALQKVANTLTQTCRDTDAVFRKGGEEFVVVVLPGTDEYAAYTAGDRVRTAVEDLELEHGGADGVPLVTVTVGTATRTNGDLTSALRDAGDAAYASKVDGRRNRVAASGP